MFVTQCVSRPAKLFPDKPALVFGNRTTTYGQLQDRVARCAGGLMQLGLSTGERIGTLVLNSDRAVELMLGAIWGGFVPNNLNIRWATPEQIYAINDCGATVLVVDKSFADRLPALRQQCPSLKHFLYIGDDAAPEGTLSYETLVEKSRPVADQCTDPQAMAILNYTGGTTGMAKGVMLSHAGIMASLATLLVERIFIPREKFLLVAPLFHVTGAYCPLANLLVGNTIFLLPAFAPLDAIKLIEAQRIGLLFMVPTMIQMTLDHPDFPKHDLSCVKFVRYGGSPISEALVRRMREVLPQVQFAQAYGQTEGLPATILPDEDHTDELMSQGRLRSAGRPSPGGEVRVFGADGRELPTGEIGEIALRSAGAMLGYWNKPEQTAKTLKDGWLYTGDAGYFDRDGYLFLVDRVKDMIVTGGENVYSAEVENAVASHPAVAACAVIGIPDDKWGEVVHAAVVLKSGQQLTADELQAHCRELIANYKLPRSVAFLDALPLTPVGKINKVALREPHWKGRQRRVG